MRIAVLTLPLLALGACATTSTPPPPPLEGTCNVESARAYVGQPATQDVGAKMLAASGARLIRWVAFGHMVTMDFNASRLTVQLGPTNLITNVACT